jgi:alkylated DNA repair protein (DNA oxidative demethylase)
MGLHQDKDEADFSMPVVSISLGDDALVRIGGTDTGRQDESVWLSSGDVIVSGRARRGWPITGWTGSARHLNLLPKGGRINLTLRVVD